MISALDVFFAPLLLVSATLRVSWIAVGHLVFLLIYLVDRPLHREQLSANHSAKITRVNKTYWVAALACAVMVFLAQAITQLLFAFSVVPPNPVLDSIGLVPCFQQFLSASNLFLLIDVLLLVSSALSLRYAFGQHGRIASSAESGMASSSLKQLFKSIRFISLICSVFCAGTLRPSLLSLAYCVVLVGLLILWALLPRRRSQRAPSWSQFLQNNGCLIARLIALYGSGQLLVVSVFRFPLLYQLLSDSMQSFLGLGPPFPWTLDYLTYHLSIFAVLLTVLLFTAVPLAEAEDSTERDSAAVVSERLPEDSVTSPEEDDKSFRDSLLPPDMRRLTRASSFTQQLTGRIEDLKDAMATLAGNVWLNYGKILSCAALTVYCFVVPSAVSVGALVLLMLILPASGRTVLRLAPVLLLYFAAQFLVMCVFMIEGLVPETDTLRRLGLSKHILVDAFLVNLVNIVPFLCFCLYCGELKPLETSLPSLISAVLRNHHEGVRDAIAADPQALTSQRDSNRRTALHIAASMGYEYIIQILLRVADPTVLDLRDRFGRTAVDYAIGGKYFTIVNRLVAAGAEVEVMDVPTDLSWERIAFECYMLVTSLLNDHGFKLVLVILYGSGLQRPDFFHVGYLLLFLLYFAVPSLTRSAWWLMVAYCQFVLVAMYGFAVLAPPGLDSSVTWFASVGLTTPVAGESILLHSSLPLVLVFLSVIQLALNRDVFSHDEEFNNAQVFAVKPVLATIGRWLIVLYDVLGLWFVYGSLIVVFLSGKPCLIHMGYLLIIVLAFLIHVYAVEPIRLLSRAWFLVVAYCGIVLFLRYAVQWPVVYDLLTSWSSSRLGTSLADIGLEKYDSGRIFLGVAPSTVILVFAVFEFRLFYLAEDEAQSELMRYSSPGLRKFIQAFIQMVDGFLKKFAFIVLAIIATLVATTAVSYPNAAYVVALVLCLPTRLGVGLMWVPFSVVSATALIVKYASLLPIFTLPGLGDFSFPDGNLWTLKALLGDLLILVFSLLHELHTSGRKIRNKSKIFFTANFAVSSRFDTEDLSVSRASAGDASPRTEAAGKDAREAAEQADPTVITKATIYRGILLVVKFVFDLPDRNCVDVAMGLLLWTAIMRRTIFSLIYLVLFVGPYVVDLRHLVTRGWVGVMILLAVSVAWQVSVASSSSPVSFSTGDPSWDAFLTLSNVHIQDVRWDILSFVFVCLRVLELESMTQFLDQYELIMNGPGTPPEEVSDESRFAQRRKYSFLLSFVLAIIITVLTIIWAVHPVYTIVNSVFLAMFSYDLVVSPKNSRPAFQIILCANLLAILLQFVYEMPHSPLVSSPVMPFIGGFSLSDPPALAFLQPFVIYILFILERTILDSQMYHSQVVSFREYERDQAKLRGESSMVRYEFLQQNTLEVFAENKRRALKKLKGVLLHMNAVGASTDDNELWDKEVWPMQPEAKEEMAVLPSPDLRASIALESPRYEGNDLYYDSDDEFERISAGKGLLSYWVEYVKHFLNKHTTHFVFTQWEIDHPTQRRLRDPDAGILSLVYKWAASNTCELCYTGFLVVFLVDPNVLNMLLPMWMFVHGLVIKPYPTRGFWLFALMLIMTRLSLRFLYQMPFFCFDNEQYFLSPIACPVGEDAAELEDFLRADHVIGIYKASAAWTFLQMICGDVVCLLLLSFHRSSMKTRGLWDLNEHDGLLSRDDPEYNSVPDMSVTLTDRTMHTVLAWLPEALKSYFYGIAPCNPDGTPNYNLKPGKVSYTPIFVVEILCLFYGIILWAPMTTQVASLSSAITRTLTSNIFSAEMVLFTFVQIMLIVADRAIFLYRSLWLKLFLHYATVVYVHAFVFVYCPWNSLSPMKSSPFLIMYYLLKVLYFVYSAKQIRHGYLEFEPSHHYITRKNTWWRSLALQTFRSIPFLYEMRMLLDWMCFRTSLDLYETLKLEDCFSLLYGVKANLFWKRMHRRGEAQNTCQKFQSATWLFFVLLVLILAPLLLFSTLNPVSQRNDVTSAEVSAVMFLGISKFPLFSVQTMTRISTVTPQDFGFFESVKFVRGQKIESVQNVTLSPYAFSPWEVSGPSLAYLVSQWQANSPDISLAISFTRQGPASNKVIQYLVTLPPLSADDKDALLCVLNGTHGNGSIPITTVSSFLQLPPSGSAVDMGRLQPRKVSYNLRLDSQPTGQLFWSISNDATPQEGLSFATVSDDYFEASFLTSTATSAGIITLYVTILFTIGRFVRLIVADQVQWILYCDIHNADDLLQLCEAIFLARSIGDLMKEEMMFRVLVRILRSPETLIKITRRKAD